MHSYTASAQTASVSDEPLDTSYGPTKYQSCKTWSATVTGLQREARLALTMNIALALIRLSDEKIGHMSTNMVLITDSISTKHFLKPATALEPLQFPQRSSHLRSRVHQGSIAILPLNHTYHLRRRLTLIL